MPESTDRLLSALRGSQLLRLLALGLLVLVLQIPVAMIGGLVGERQERRQAAIGDVTAAWGKAQAITGPVLVVPYTERRVENSGSAGPVTRTEARRAVFLASELRLRGSVAVERRWRGIFAVPVYRLQLALEGEFTRPDFATLGLDPAAIDWERAVLSIGIADARALRSAPMLRWNDAGAGFRPGTGGLAEADGGIHAVVGFPAGAATARFALPLDLNGSLGLRFVPFAETTTVELQANHADPGFTGNWLPVERSVSAGGFTARWSIPHLGRNFPQGWVDGQGPGAAIAESQFGVDLLTPIDHYRMAERSLKYAGLFILLTFAVVWLFEVLDGRRVHPIQYLLIGAALCLFYLLELSLAEHLRFALTYALASLAVVATVGGYTLAVLQRRGRALVVAAAVALLYLYLYVLLVNEDYALLIGSLGLFLVLATIMYATRRVDWYAGRAPPRAGGAP